jgi:hypothetical protein
MVHIVVEEKHKKKDKVQEIGICNSAPSQKTFRDELYNWYGLKYTLYFQN